MRILFFRSTILLLLFCVSFNVLKGQDEITIKMTMEEAIDIARKQSVESFRVKNMYLSKYWQFRSYRAGLRPELNLSTSLLNYDNALSKRWINGSEAYVPNHSVSNSGLLSLEQALPFSGGNVYVSSSLARDHTYIKDSSFFTTAPIVNIGIKQPLSLHNDMKWEAKIEPLKFEQAKFQYLKNVESLSKSTVQHFFGLLLSQINLEIATTNYANADTLYRIAKGRFEIGTITQDELLDLELTLLNSSINLTKSKMDLKRSQNSLKSFLKLENNIVVECVVPSNIPDLKLSFEEVYSKALDNSPELIGYKQQLLEQDRRVSSSKAASLFNGSIQANVGIQGSAEYLDDVYNNPGRSQSVDVRMNIPILDWGKRKGDYLMSRSNREVVKAEVEQALVEFEQDLMVKVMEFNLQEEQVAIAQKADSTAYLGYDITKKRFYIDKVDVIKLNSARNSLSSAKRSYINALKSYWSYYFEIRETALYDFQKDQSLQEDFDALVQSQRF